MREKKIAPSILNGFEYAKRCGASENLPQNLVATHGEHGGAMTPQSLPDVTRCSYTKHLC